MASEADVIVVGAGLAGLCCARHLHQAGRDFLLLEAADSLGGRIRTDHIDGFQLDRGFQVLLTAYPEARRTLDYDALDLRPFQPGALVRFAGAFHRVTDPWRRPLQAIPTAFAPIGTLMDKLRVARLRSRVMRADLEALFGSPILASFEFLRSFGFSDSMIDRFFRPFFGGVFLEPDLATSSRMLQFVFRMFSAGDAALPAAGMGAIPGQLAALLPRERIRLRTEVVRIERMTVTLASGERLPARSIVLATEGPAAARLIEGLDAPSSRGVTCLYFAAEKPPIDEPVLVLDAERRGPVNNLCVPSSVVSSYAPPGASLISAAVLGTPDADDAELGRQVRRQLEGWFGAEVNRWEHLQTYRISHALPAIEPRWTPGPDRPVEARPGVYLCGDHRENPSIQGAMASGRRAAECIVAAGK